MLIIYLSADRFFILASCPRQITRSSRQGVYTIFLTCQFLSVREKSKLSQVSCALDSKDHLEVIAALWKTLDRLAIFWNFTLHLSEKKANYTFTIYGFFKFNAAVFGFGQKDMKVSHLRGEWGKVLSTTIEFNCVHCKVFREGKHSLIADNNFIKVVVYKAQIHECMPHPLCCLWSLKSGSNQFEIFHSCKNWNKQNGWS